MSRLAVLFLLYVVASTEGQVQHSSSTCTDHDLLCPFWASIGECGRNPSYMLATCQAACDVHNKCSSKKSAAVTCTDLHPSCAIWSAQKQCSINPYYMNWRCSKSCSPSCGASAPSAPVAGPTHPLATSGDKKNDNEWQNFKKEHGKNYKDDPDEEQHYKQYLKSKNDIDNSKFGFGQGLNQFSDLSPTEMEDHKGFTPEEHHPNETTHLHPENTAVPPSVDWRQKGYVTPVKDQGPCGSCFTFATTGVLEGQMFRKTGKLVSLSEQNIVDCAPVPPMAHHPSAQVPNNGCHGGKVSNAVKWVQTHGGLDANSVYPYVSGQKKTSMKKPCKESKTKAAVATGYVAVPKGSADGLRSAIATIGPVYIGISSGVDSFKHFKGPGIYDDPACAKQKVDHAVLVVGYGTENGKDYWIVKNSWGTKWGDKGYIKFARNTGGLGVCNLLTKPGYALV